MWSSIITNLDKNGLHKTKDLNVSGHSADQFGLFGGLFFDRSKGYGLVYRGNGVSRDMYNYMYDFSAYNKWSIYFIQLADDIAQFDYPVNRNEIKDNNKYNKSYIIYIIISIAVIAIFTSIILISRF